MPVTVCFAAIGHDRGRRSPQDECLQPGQEDLAYQLGEKLSEMTDHFLLMTATPHKGESDNFCLFLRLLDADVYADVKSLEDAMQRNSAPFYLRRIKEAWLASPTQKPA